MTLVIYKDFRIEVERRKDGINFVIFTPEKHLLVEDTVLDSNIEETITDCKFTVDDFLANPQYYRRTYG